MLVCTSTVSSLPLPFQLQLDATIPTSYLRLKQSAGILFTVAHDDRLCCCAGTQGELQALALNPATKFSDMFETAKVGGDGKCPAGFSPANLPSSYYKTKVNGRDILVQCLKIKVRQDGLAMCLSTVVKQC